MEAAIEVISLVALLQTWTELLTDVLSILSLLAALNCILLHCFLPLQPNCFFDWMDVLRDPLSALFLPQLQWKTQLNVNEQVVWYMVMIWVIPLSVGPSNECLTECMFQWPIVRLCKHPVIAPCNQGIVPPIWKLPISKCGIIEVWTCLPLLPSSRQENALWFRCNMQYWMLCGFLIVCLLLKVSALMSVHTFVFDAAVGVC